MICPNCGTDNSGGRVFCSACGKPMEFAQEDVYGQASSEAAEEEQIKLERNMRQFLIGGILLFLLALVFKVKNKPETIPEFSDLPAVPMSQEVPDPEMERHPHPQIVLE